ncbi:MAG TPA: hypothetical protein VGN57_14985 [Pirellulaceae bacterium]|jgi:hypothetical protein|nr:hypothetical protein [Pirellulaceae bacterium]
MTLLLTKLCDLKDGEEGDFFAQLTGKEELLTRNAKPYGGGGRRSPAAGFVVGGSIDFTECCSDSRVMSIQVTIAQSRKPYTKKRVAGERLWNARIA